MTPLAPDLSAFLQTHLPNECGASRHTIAAYARAFSLLLRFAAGQRKRAASELAIEDLDVQTIRTFLEHIEERRANSVRSRNARLAAIKSFFRFIEHRHPVCLEQAVMVRAVPTKRTDAKLIDYLTKEEVRALLAAPNRYTPGGLRDRAMLHLAYAGGLRASELLAVRMDDFTDGSGRHGAHHAGRKCRISTPSKSPMAAMISKLSPSASTWGATARRPQGSFSKKLVRAI